MIRNIKILGKDGGFYTAYENVFIDMLSYYGTFTVMVISKYSFNGCPDNWYSRMTPLNVLKLSIMMTENSFQTQV